MKEGELEEKSADLGFSPGPTNHPRSPPETDWGQRLLCLVTAESLHVPGALQSPSLEQGGPHLRDSLHTTVITVSNNFLTNGNKMS